MNKSTQILMEEAALDYIMRRRSADGLWHGQLSSSAISTAVALFALHLSDAASHEANVSKAVDWLLLTMQENGTWGDSPESPSNMTATLLSFAALSSVGQAPEATKSYLSGCFGGFTDTHIVKGVIRYYGKDLTFSGPILAMCALSGVLSDWNKIPRFPFEFALLPQSVYRFLRLPVVSYAIPAFIAVGLMVHNRVPTSWFYTYRTNMIPQALRLLRKLQPVHGGYLEAAPLTGFVALCLCGAGYGQHEVALASIQFLRNTQRQDGSWPIDTNLSTWVTTLVAKVVGSSLSDAPDLIQKLKSFAEKQAHPFTGVQAGGWGWTSLPGSVPDADDTSGALLALFELTKGDFSDEVEHGLKWLLSMQNNDGGMPTFCKGWGKLPFDRSTPDITAHAFLAMHKWLPFMPETLSEKCSKSMNRMLTWMRKAQLSDGSWLPLWFGDQDATNALSPVYGTATTVEYLSHSNQELARDLISRGLNFLLKNQNADGGWGGMKMANSKVSLTARALTAIATSCVHSQNSSDVHRVSLMQGLAFLEQRFDQGQLFDPEPIGLYFSKLWYSEDLYQPVFVLQALRAVDAYQKSRDRKS